jgi:DNA (cytosine-5)-methyltransferase 1
LFESGFSRTKPSSTPKRAGKTWERFLELSRAQGYVIEHRLLCAADFGAPTTRTRLFIVARRDGAPICWPQPTHSRKLTRGLQKWRSAAECINFSLPSKSIFDRPKPLVDATCRRVAHGLKRYVLDNAAVHRHGDALHEPARARHQRAAAHHHDGTRR